MNAFVPKLPTGQALYVFVICLAIGLFVIFKYCLEQFNKPIAERENNAPWNFVMPSLLTSGQRYLTGFAIYCSTILLIFFAASIFIGPGNFFLILKTIFVSLSQSRAELQDLGGLGGNSLQDYPTFPIVVAFYIVGLNPNLPRALDFELPIRKLAYHLAYIPKNMDRIFNYMRFSQFDLPEDKLVDAYAAAELRRPIIDADDLHTILPAFNRAVLLYAQAGTLAGDLAFQGADQLVQRLDLDAFKQHRAEIQNVGVNLQGIDSRLLDVDELNAGDRQRAIKTIQRDLSRNLEVLYVIFACASTVQDIGRISDRLRAIGFSSAFPPRSAIPWDPILRVIGAAALVLFAAYEIAANTWLGNDIKLNVPPNTPGILKLLLIILFIHAVAIGQALNLRSRLIVQDRYFSETGRGTSVAFVKLFIRSWIVALMGYLLLNLDALDDVQMAPSTTQAIEFYIEYYMIWALVPAICGVMTAYTIDRPSETPLDAFFRD